MPPSDPNSEAAIRDSSLVVPPGDGEPLPAPDHPTKGHMTLHGAMAMDSAELAAAARNRRTVGSSSVKSRNSQVGSRRASSVGGTNARSSIQNPFFLVTLVLGVVSWFIAFISQAFVTARDTNSTIGTLWFAFVIQTLLLGWIIASMATSLPIRSSANTIAHLASISLVLASIGINNNVFSPVSAERATAAGWIIAAIVDFVWVIYFSSEEWSPIRVTLDSMGNNTGQGMMTGGEGGGEGGDVNEDVEHVDEEGNPIKTVRRGFSLTGKLPPITPPTFKLKSARLRKARPDSTEVPNVTVEETVPENGEGAPRDTTTTSVRDVDHRRRSGAARSMNTSINPEASSVGGDIPMDSRPVSSARSGTGRAPTSTSGRGSAGSRVKAVAMYNYNGNKEDPHELSFGKGDVFDITDRSGKWWEAMDQNGKVGIVPSNYVRVVEQTEDQ